jgi:hypothetical protein
VQQPRAKAAVAPGAPTPKLAHSRHAVRVDHDDLTRIGDALHWLGAAEVQARRFLDAFERNRAERSQRIGANDWRRGLYSTEAHFLLVAIKHLATALDRLPEALRAPRLSHDLRTAADLLRNVLEHWDEQRAAFSDSAIKKDRSGKRFNELFPEFTPWSFGWSNAPGQGTRIGGAFHVEGALDEMQEIETALVPLWTQALHDVGLLPYRGPIVDFAPPTVAMATPDDVAVASFGGRARAAVAIAEDAHAVVLAVAETDPESGIDGCPWWVICSRDADGWSFAGGGTGAGGWHPVDAASGRGIAYLGGVAPDGEDVVQLRFRGALVEVRVQEGYFAWACFDARPDELGEVLEPAP